MNSRTWALKVLYISLAVAVASGIAVLFVPSRSDLIGRLIATAIMTAASTGIFIAGLKAMDSPRTTPLGIGIVGIILSSYLLFFLGIWQDFIAPSFRQDEEIFLSGLLILGCGIPILIGATCLGFRKYQKSGMTFAICWGVVLCWSILDIWGALDADELLLPVINLSWMLALAYLSDNRVLRLVGITSSFISFCFLEIVISQDLQPPVTLLVLLPFIISSWIVCVIGAYNLINIRKPKNSARLLERITMAVVSIHFLAGAALALMTVGFGVAEDDLEWLVRILLGFGILGSTALMTTLITQAARSFMVAKADSSFVFAVICPRCNSQIELKQGKNKCSYCSLVMKINFDSPTCKKCMYDLSKSDSKICPECGDAVLVKDMLE